MIFFVFLFYTLIGDMYHVIQESDCNLSVNTIPI